MHQGAGRQVLRIGDLRHMGWCFAASFSRRFIADSDKEWFDIELLNTVEQEFNEDVVEVIREPRYFVDFMRDAPEPTGETREFAD